MTKFKPLRKPTKQRTRTLNTKKQKSKNIYNFLIIFGLIGILVFISITIKFSHKNKKNTNIKRLTFTTLNTHNTDSSTNAVNTNNIESEINKRISMFYDKLFNMLTEFESKLYQNYTKYICEKMAELIETSELSKSDYIQVVSEYAATLYLNLAGTNGTLDDIPIYSSSVFDYLILLDNCYGAVSLLEQRYKYIPENRKEKRKFIDRFIYQQMLLKFVINTLLSFLTNCKQIIFDIYKKQIMELNESKSVIYNIFTGFVYLFEQIKMDMFEEGLFRIKFKYGFVLSVKYLLSSIGTFTKFILLNFVLVLSTLFELDENGNILKFRSYITETIINQVEDKDKLNIKVWVDDVYKECKHFGSSLNESNLNIAMNFYSEFVKENRLCLVQLYKLKVNNMV